MTGVTINDGSYCVVAQNRFSNCGVGVTVWWWYMCPREDLDICNKILDNFIFNPRGVGISCGGGTQWNDAVGNIIRGAGKDGIVLAGSFNRAIGNTVRESAGHGIVLRGDHNDAFDNRCTDNSRARPGVSDGIHVAGARCRVTNNACPGPKDKPSQRYGISVAGRDNYTGKRVLDVVAEGQEQGGTPERQRPKGDTPCGRSLP